jgi:hypothetical protein
MEYWRRQAEKQADRELVGGAEHLVEVARKQKALTDYFDKMKAKCEAAARRPWLVVEPDPPWSEW